jgi:hypothetical protein
MPKKILGVPTWLVLVGAIGGWYWYTKSKGLTLLGKPMTVAAPTPGLTSNLPMIPTNLNI